MLKEKLAHLASCELFHKIWRIGEPDVLCWYIPPQLWAQFNSFLRLLAYSTCLRPQCQKFMLFQASEPTANKNPWVDQEASHLMTEILIGNV